jgi:hypothetical protein
VTDALLRDDIHRFIAGLIVRWGDRIEREPDAAQRRMLVRAREILAAELGGGGDVPQGAGAGGGERCPFAWNRGIGHERVS